MITERLHYEISRVCPIEGVDSSGNISFKPEATELEKQAANEVLSSYVDTPEADAIWEGSKKKNAAKESLTAPSTPSEIAIFTALADTYTQINDVREAIGLPRILEPDIIARLRAALSS